MEDQEEKQHKVITVEEVDHNAPVCPINSPRSLEACKRLGVQLSELNYSDFHAYKSSTFDLKNMHPQLAKLRYDQLEKLREQTFKDVIEERKEIINEFNASRNMSKSKIVFI